MLSRFLLMSFFLMPTSTWATCTSHEVGTVTFSDCPAEGHAVNNPAARGVTLQPLPDTAAKPEFIKLVRPHETVDIGGHPRNATATTSEGAPDASGAPEANKATNKQNNTKAQKKPAK